MGFHPVIARSVLFERLARAAPGRLSVLTPNRRLAQALSRDFDLGQRARGLATWETADVLPLDAFVQRLWEDALYSPLAGSLPVLLSPSQEAALWDEAIAAARVAHAVFSAPGAAQQCREAWRVMHAWRIELGREAHDEDAAAFLDWSSRYERATRARGQTDPARLPDIVAPLLAEPALPRPEAVVLHGFDIVPPQARAFFAALGAAGTGVIELERAETEGRCVRVALTEHRDELRAAARWARTRLEADSGARIGVVVPNLAGVRARVHRIFADTMQPDHMAAGEAEPLPFNISLGAALSDYPLVGDALGLIALCGPGVEFGLASRLVRSPFVGGAEKEMAARARLDARLRERAAPTVNVDSLLRLAASPRSPAAPLLLERLGRLADQRKSGLFGTKPASEWAKAFVVALRAAGFPGERALDSREHQALDRWHEVLGELAALDGVVGPMGYREAHARLERLAREAIFQPQSDDVPVQVLGVLESAGIEFDHLWVLGMNDDAWPLAASPNPFIPARLQRAAGIPQADPVASLELDRAITRGWQRSAREVVFSLSRRLDESELAPSPLVAGVPEVALESLGIASWPGFRQAIRSAVRLEAIDDRNLPAAAAGPRAGGTSLFRDQAACPFRAAARHRLGSKPLETPRPGLDARDRGSLLHAMLAHAWERLGDRATLAAAGADRLEAILEECADATLAQEKRHRSEALAGRFGELERARLVRLAREWLAMERERPGFRVVKREEKAPVTFGGVTVNAKLDRMDELEAGGLAIIDYKTGACATKDWMGQRPNEPQLPMYARSAGDAVAAVAFGIVRTGQMGFKGIGRAADLIPGVNLVSKDRSPAARQHPDWKHLVETWSRELEALGRGFLAGDARVDPKRGSESCATCDQQLFCRIAEKAPFMSSRSEPDE